MFLRSDLHVNRPLSDILIKFDWTQIGWARNRWFPRKTVPKLSNQMRSISRENMLRLREGKTGEGGKVRRIQFATGPTQTYNCELFAFETAISQIEADNADDELQYVVEQMDQPVIAMNLRMEALAIKHTLRDPAQLTQNTALNPNQLWSNRKSVQSDPIADLIAACTRVRSQTQRKANRLDMDHLVWAELCQHPNVIKRVLFQTGRTGAMLTPEILEDILGPWLEKGSINIYAARYNNADEGEEEELLSFLGGDVLVGYVDEPGMMSWGLGYEFCWNAYDGEDPIIVLQYPSYEDPLGSNNFRVVTAVDYKVTNPKSAYLIKGSVDTSLPQFFGELD